MRACMYKQSTQNINSEMLERHTDRVKSHDIYLFVVRFSVLHTANVK